ncbi:cytochrome P450 [Ochromonadaceae sp. CCMP2298]|nr:cytochrome P450 [Ochromonadaceae sp. CCMP2298]
MEAKSDSALTPSALGAICAACVLAGAGVWAYADYRKRDKRYPPRGGPPMTEVIRTLQNQKGLKKLTIFQEASQCLQDGQFGRTKYGATFRLALPFTSPFFTTSDFRLARLVLQGDQTRQEFDKGYHMTFLNYFDRSVSSLLTHKTANPHRERARKALAPGFSTNNLLQTWPYLREGLIEEFRSLSALAREGRPLVCRERLLQFALRVLARSAFGVEFTMDGTEDETNVNGLEYIRCQEVAAAERVKEFSMPMRPYFFWSAQVREARAAEKTLQRIAQKTLDLHTRARDSAEGAEGSSRKSLMQLIAAHAYPSDVARLADINIITFAGHDTTGFSFCFLLMELARRPEARAKLQAEIDSVMPAAPLDSPLGSPDPSDPTSAQHGDPKLVSALANLEYLNCCIKEGTRLWPVAAAGGSREVAEDFEWEGMLLPKGSTIQPHFYSIFRERWIDRPHEFLPERWLPSNPQLPLLKEMYIPFSVGKRSCIGQNMALFQLRLLAAYFLHYFDFELQGEPSFEFFITLKPVDLLLSVSERRQWGV